MPNGHIICMSDIMYIHEHSCMCMCFLESKDMHDNFQDGLKFAWFAYNLFIK